MIGYAVGLGNVWRFPYLCFKNGGGAFLIPYLICLILLGIPMFALECAFGQYGGKGPLTVWTINPTFKGLGVSMVAASCIVFVYYDIIIAWSLRYLVASMTSTLPWIDCHDCSCLLYNKNVTEDELEVLRYNNSLGYPCLNISMDNSASSPSELYFNEEILNKSEGIGTAGDIQWELLVANFVAYLVIFLVLLKGIQSLGKVVYFTAVFPYILLTILLVRSAMLEGAYDGIVFYLTPKWDRLTDAAVWSDAAVQIFFSLSACMGGLIAMSSYNRFNNNIIRDAFMIPIINCLTSFYAGFVVFSTLGNMAKIKDLPVGNVTQGGPGLAFVVYPEAISSMPVSTLWAILFFFMICILGFSTQFSAAETIMTSILDEFPAFFKRRPRQVLFRVSVCMLAFLLGIPMITQGGFHLLNLVDEAVLGFPLLFIGLLEYVAIIHFYGYENFALDVKSMLGFSPFIYFRATWTVISPVLLTAVIVFKAYQMEDIAPAWSGLIYYLIVIFVLMWVPLWFFYYSCKRGLWEMMRPEKEWTSRRQLGNGGTGEAGLDENGLAIDKKPNGDFSDRGHDNQSFQKDTYTNEGDYTKNGIENATKF